ncbi:hypothetical protein GGR28_003751 [Lewinella aquimaris]|uniref:Uncharacterized protein n=1 Tax=Neolewinella aquimaris TaxID=1835722 RepID=A0A840E620_9BACT|nr:hypothetical protein [Neolewinella aquimaris]MBB4081104.1 hypothetical protein [Neolewinella aquimaris]
MNKIILIEDRLDFAQNFITESAKNGYAVVHGRSYERLTEILKVHGFDSVCIVLDIKAYLREDDEVERPEFIGRALTLLNKEYPELFRVIFTADEDEFTSLKRTFNTEKIFLKTPEGLRDLWLIINETISGLELSRLEKTYEAVINVFNNGYLNDTGKRLFYQIIQTDIASLSQTRYGGHLRDMRTLQELIYKTINGVKPQIIGADMFKGDGMIDFNKLMNHLSGNRNPRNRFRPTTTVYQNSTIEHAARTIYRSCGEYVHYDPNQYTLSVHTLTALRGLISELILWSEKILK